MFIIIINVNANFVCITILYIYYRFISAVGLGLSIAPIAMLLHYMASINSSILDISNVVSSADGDDFQVGSLKRIGMLQMLFAKQGGVGIGKI